VFSTSWPTSSVAWYCSLGSWYCKLSAVLNTKLVNRRWYLLSDIRKISQSHDLAVDLARAHSRDLLDGFSVDEQLLVIDAVHPLDHLAEARSVVVCVDYGGAIGGLSVQERRVRTHHELVDVELHAVFRYKAKVGELACAIVFREDSSGTRVV